MGSEKLFAAPVSEPRHEPTTPAGTQHWSIWRGQMPAVSANTLQIKKCLIHRVYLSRVVRILMSSTVYPPCANSKPMISRKVGNCLKSSVRTRPPCADALSEKEAAVNATWLKTICCAREMCRIFKQELRSKEMSRGSDLTLPWSQYGPFLKKEGR